MIIQNRKLDTVINISSDVFSKGVLVYDIESDKYKLSLMKNNGDRVLKEFTPPEDLTAEIKKIIEKES